MGRAIGFAIVLITLWALMPSVFHGLAAFFAALLDKSTSIVGAINLPPH